MISLHSALLNQQRGITGEQFKILADQIQYAALGLAAGCEDEALKMAALLCHAWQRNDFYQALIRPEVRGLFILFYEHLNIPILELKPYRARPCLDEIIDQQRWLKADPDELYSLLNKACDEHTKNAPQGPFQALPAVIILIFKLRMMQGLKNPALTHPLFEKPLKLPKQLMENDKDGYDGLLEDVKKRMTANGFNAPAIKQAIFTQSSLQISSTTGVMPLDPRFTKPTSTWNYQVNNTLTKHQQAYQAVTNLQANQTEGKQTNRGSNLIYTGACWLVRFFTLFIFYLAGENATLGIMQALNLTQLYMGLVICWGISPFLFGAFAALKMQTRFIRDCGMLFSGITLYFYTSGVYSIYTEKQVAIENAPFLLWGPGAELIWIGGWIYLLVRKKG